jgi:hypothetical protein
MVHEWSYEKFQKIPIYPIRHWNQVREKKPVQEIPPSKIWVEIVLLPLVGCFRV